MSTDAWHQLRKLLYLFPIFETPKLTSLSDATGDEQEEWQAKGVDTSSGDRK